MKSIMKRIYRLPFVQKVIRSRAVFNVLYAGALTIFLYHDVTTEPAPFSVDYDLNVPPEVFDRQLSMIRERFNVIDMDQLVSGSFETPAAMITFDDGLRGVFDNALPVLISHNCPATVFMNMAPVEGELFWAGLVCFLLTVPGFAEWCARRREGPSHLTVTPETVNGFLDRHDRIELERAARNYYGKFATKVDLERANESGLISLGNHLYNHHNAACMSAQSLKNSYLTNSEQLASFRSTGAFSFPFGQPDISYTEESVEVVRGLGAHPVFSAYSAVNRRGSGAVLHRVGMTSTIDSEYRLDNFLFQLGVKAMIKRLVGA